jgi:hypothetical protein
MTTGWSSLNQEQQEVAARMFGALDMIDTVTKSVAAPRRVGFSDLFAFANDPNREMTPDLSQALRQDSALEADLLHLLDRVAAYHFPRAAAASSGPVAQRDGDLYRIALRPSRAEPSQIYIIIELADLDSVPPELIYVCRPGQPCEKHRLPIAHDGAIQILADLGSSLVEALRDGRAEVFLR